MSLEWRTGSDAGQPRADRKAEDRPRRNTVTTMASQSLGGDVKGIKAWAAAAVMACLLGSAGHAMPLLEVSSARSAFRIDLPEGCVLQDGPQQATYATFYVACGGRIYAGIYAGNAPDPTLPRSRLIETDDKWPRNVQVWSEIVPGDQIRADAIAASVKVRRMKVALG